MKNKEWINREGWKWFEGILISSFFILPLAIICGCKTSAPLPPQNLSAPGWTVLRGQAVWKPPHNRPEIAGDLVMATNANGNFFIAFQKTPFVLATAQVEDQQWEIRFGDDKYAWRGGGVPPDKFIWFQLPRVMLDKNATDDWKFDRESGNLWRLQNPNTGEALEGEFFQ
jgi:hypothetical protein